MRPFHDPTPRFPTRCSLDPLGLWSLGGDVHGEAKLLEGLSDLFIRVPFIQTQVLLVFLGDYRPLDRNAGQRLFDHLHVGAVGPVYGQPDRNAVALDQQAALGAFLGSVGGVFARLFSPRGVPWSCTRPCSATASRCPSGPHIPATPSSTAPRRPPQRPTPESGRAPWTPGRTWWRPALSTGNRCAARTRWHPCRPGRGCVAVHRRSDGC